MDEFESMSNEVRNELPFTTLVGHFLECSKNQTASRFIQDWFGRLSYDEKIQIFTEIQSEIVSLMKDAFGNYIVQKLVEDNL